MPPYGINTGSGWADTAGPQPEPEPKGSSFWDIITGVASSTGAQAPATPAPQQQKPSGGGFWDTLNNILSSGGKAASVFITPGQQANVSPTPAQAAAAAAAAQAAIDAAKPWYTKWWGVALIGAGAFASYKALKGK